MWEVWDVILEIGFVGFALISHFITDKNPYKKENANE